MKISFWSVGKSHEQFVKAGIEMYSKRISNYFRVEWKIITMKNSSENDPLKIKKLESNHVLKMLLTDDILVLLDEEGKEFTSDKIAQLMQTEMNRSTKNLIFLIGGAYGVDEKILNRANILWCLSKLTLPHQMVRLILAEQVYRACTIIRNEKYHHG